MNERTMEGKSDALCDGSKGQRKNSVERLARMEKRVTGRAV